jgi:hypothetical protein
MGAGKQSDTSIAYAARAACRSIVERTNVVTRTAAKHSPTARINSTTAKLDSLTRSPRRLSPLLDQICPHSQIQNQTTRYSNQY